MLLAERCESERLRQIIKELQRHRFGRRAETLPEEQMLLGLEDVEQTAACDEATADQAAPPNGLLGLTSADQPGIAAGASAADRDRRRHRRQDPSLLCKGELHRIGEDKSERLDLVPAQFRVLVTRRPKYACRRCEDGVTQAP